MDEVRHAAHILTDTGQGFHIDLFHVHLGDIVGIFQRIRQTDVCFYIFIRNFDVITQIFHDAFRTQHLFRQSLQEQLLYLNTAHVTIGIPTETHQLQRLIAVQRLQTLFQVNGDIARIAHIPFHILRNIYFYAAHSIHDLNQCIKVDLYIMVDADTQQFFQLQNRRFGAMFLAAVSMDCIEFCHAIAAAQQFFHFAANGYAGISGHRDQINAFLLTVIMHHKGYVCSCLVFIYTKYSHIQLDIFPHQRIQNAHFSCLCNAAAAKGHIARCFVVGKAGTACQNHKGHYHRDHDLKKCFDGVEWFSSLRISSSAHGIPHSFVKSASSAAATGSIPWIRQSTSSLIPSSSNSTYFPGSPR